MTYCGTDPYSDGCYYWKDYSNGNIESTSGQKCFTLMQVSSGNLYA